MSEQPYFDAGGEVSTEPGHWVTVGGLSTLNPLPRLIFRPVTSESVMTNFVTFEPDAPAPMHHHAEQQIAIVLSGELTFTAGGGAAVRGGGGGVVIPPHVPHGGAAGPEGCTVIDVFTPPRAGIVALM